MLPNFVPEARERALREFLKNATQCVFTEALIPPNVFRKCFSSLGDFVLS